MLDWIDFPTKNEHSKFNVRKRVALQKLCAIMLIRQSRLNQRPICYGYSDAVKQKLTAHSHGTQFQLAFGRYFLPLDSYEMV